MSSQKPNTGRIGPGLALDSFLGAIWGTFAGASLLLLVRLYARFDGPRRLYVDDGFLLSAYALALTTTVLCQYNSSDMWEFLSLVASQIRNPPPPDAPPPTEADLPNVRWLRISLAAYLIFYTGLTAVRLSFLFFFRRLGHNVTRFGYLWWPNLVLTFAVWFGCVGSTPYPCLLSTPENVQDACNSPSAIDYATASLQAFTILDVVSDSCILVIPFVLLWNLRVRMVRKIILLVLFSFTIVKMVVSIVRAVDIARTRWSTGQNDPTYIWMWTAVEVNIGTNFTLSSLFLNASG
jgi:hypothetical protein